MRNCATLYSSRGGLEPGSPVFLGREETIRDIFMRLSGENSLPGVAVVGPHRIGKTSLLKQLLDANLRARYLGRPDVWHVAYVDVSQRQWTDFSSFRATVLSALGGGDSEQLLRRHDSLADGIRRIARVHQSHTIILVLDEFNYIAPELGKDEQAELRGAIESIANFSIVIGVSRGPDELLEHVEDMSQLAPLINHALPSLKALSEHDGRQLISIARITAGFARDRDAEDWILDRIGTHPLLLHAACFAWYRFVEHRLLRELTQSERHEAGVRIEEEVALQWRHVSRTLSVSARALMKGEPIPRGVRYDAAQEELKEFGVLPWFRRHPNIRGNFERPIFEETLDVVGDESELCDRLSRLVEEINRANELELSRPEKLFRTDHLVGDDEVYLRRHVRDRQGFGQMISALTRLLYDGSDGVVPPTLRGSVKPKLPNWCYTDHRSVIQEAVALRNHCMHIEAPDAKVAAEHLKSAGDIYFKYTSRRAPGSADWDMVRIGLLNAAIEFMRRLSHFIPLKVSLTADEFFGAVV